MPQSLWQKKCGFSLNHSSEDEGDTASQSEPTKVTTNIPLEDELSTLSIQDDTPSPQEHYSDVIAMSLVYYSRDIGVKSLALFC